MTTTWKVGAVAALICVPVGVVALGGPPIVLSLPLITFACLAGWLRWKLDR